MRNSFVRYISHELRTPLNTLYLGLQFLQSDGTISTNRSLSKLVKNARDACDLALQVLTDIVTFVIVEEGLLEMRKYDVAVADELKSIVSLYEDKVCLRLFSF